MRVLVVVLFALAPALSSAQSAQSWDFSIGAIYQDSLSVGGEGGPETPTPDTSSLSVKSELGFTANFTYNINEHFAVGLDIDYLKPDYTAILVSEDPADADVRIDHSLTQWNGRLKGTWNITEGPLVPYVDFGYGWTNIDSNVADGPPVTGCTRGGVIFARASSVPSVQPRRAGAAASACATTCVTSHFLSSAGTAGNSTAVEILTS